MTDKNQPDDENLPDGDSKDSHLSNDSIRELIEGELAPDGPVFKAIVDHVKRCEECQRTQEQLLSDYAEASRIPLAINAASEHQLIRLIGKGGLGMVFVYEDTALRRQVAIKLINPRKASARAVARFEREYRITSSLEHAGVCPVFGIGQTANGSKYYMMRYIRNKNFAVTIKEFHRDHGQETLSRKNSHFIHLLDQFISVARTIEFAHSRGIVHRDIKPANIVVDQSNTAIVLDWGLAKRLDERNWSQERMMTLQRRNLLP